MTEITTEQYRAMVDASMSESAFQSQVIALAKMRGWRVHHSRPVRVQRGNGSVRYQTPIQGDAGFPDLVLARAGRVVFAELKAKAGKLSPDQSAWIGALTGADEWGAHAVYVWRPSDWDEVMEVLA